MELKHLQYFVVSVDMGSLSRAAEVLYTTQPHISKVIQQLESKLGMTLLERTPSGVVITENGKKVYEYARKILANMQKITDIKQEIAAQKLMLSSMPSQELAQLFAEFFNGERDLSVRFQEGTLEKVLHQVSHHQVELGFVFVSGFQRQVLRNMIRHKKLDFYPLKKTELMLFVGPRNPYYHQQHITWPELQRLQYVQNQEDEVSLVRHVGHLKDEADFRQLQIAAVVSNDHAMIQMLMGTQLASINCRLGTGSIAPLRAIPLADCSSHIEFGYVKRSGTELSEYAGRFVEFLKSQL